MLLEKKNRATHSLVSKCGARRGPDPKESLFRLSLFRGTLVAVAFAEYKLTYLTIKKLEFGPFLPPPGANYLSTQLRRILPSWSNGQRCEQRLRSYRQPL